MIDFIIVGRGLASTVLANTFYQNGITFKVIGLNTLSNSSLVAAGIWNPIVFKRLTLSWKAYQCIPVLNSFYNECEAELGARFVYHRPIIKAFVEEQEKQLWLKKSKNELAEFLDSKIYSDKSLYNHCNINGEYSLVKRAGNVDIPTFINASDTFFKDHLIQEHFNYNQLNYQTGWVNYNGIEARNIIFCEGHLVKNNPFFNWIPLKPAKGEVVTLKSETLSLNQSIFNKNGFIFEHSDGNYKCGATYEWEDLTDDPTPKGLNDLTNKLTDLISSEYNITGHKAGVRPASVDRRPIIGKHPAIENFFVFNGLGSKGVMLAPYFANNFVLFYLQKQALNFEADVKRFYSEYNRGV